jgi:hypothetical protein
MQGVNLRAVQEALGHKSIAMTVRYSHLSPDFQLEAVERLVPASQRSPGEPSDTATDTGVFLPVERESVHVH